MDAKVNIKLNKVEIASFHVTCLRIVPLQLLYPYTQFLISVLVVEVCFAGAPSRSLFSLLYNPECSPSISLFYQSLLAVWSLP